MFQDVIAVQMRESIALRCKNDLLGYYAEKARALGKSERVQETRLNEI